MFTRLTGWLIAPTWLVAMSWLVAHDILPGLTAQTAPTLQVTEWLRREGRRTQYAVSDATGRIGTLWSSFLLDEHSIRREDIVYLERLPIELAPLRIDVSSVFTAEGTLDEFTLHLANVENLLTLHGERFHSDFSFTLRVGTVERQYKVPLTDGQIMTGALNPISQIGRMTVGQRWRIQVFNPLAAVTGIGERFRSLLVEITGEERIETPSGPRNCLIVEAPGVKGWVDAEGAVQRQEVNLPLIGRLRVEREREFDDDARRAVPRARSALVRDRRR